MKAEILALAFSESSFREIGCIHVSSAVFVDALVNQIVIPVNQIYLCLIRNISNDVLVSLSLSICGSHIQNCGIISTIPDGTSKFVGELK